MSGVATASNGINLQLNLQRIIISIIKMTIPNNQLKYKLNKILFYSSDKLKNTCQSPECIATAADVLDTLNQNVNPCDNFYNFACGGLINGTLLSDEMMTVNQYSKVYQKMIRQLLALISEEPTENEIRPFSLVKRFFKSCMNRTRIEEDGIKPLVALKESLGGWPCVDGDEWDSSWNWIRAARKARRLGLGTNYLFSFWLGFDAKNMSIRRLTVFKIKSSSMKLDIL